MSEKECKYPDCVNFSPDVDKYCTNGCMWDHSSYLDLYCDEENKEPM
jgi:hypothetical protein